MGVVPVGSSHGEATLGPISPKISNRNAVAQLLASAISLRNRVAVDACF